MNEKKTKTPAVIIILLIIMMTMMGFLVYTNLNLNAYVAEQKKKEADALEQENSYQEDGYVVADEYEIKSTKAISDAYISGDDSELSDEDRETLDMAKKVMDEVIKDGMTPYEKEEAIYTWMVKNISQGASTTVTLPTQSGGDQYTPHGVLSGNGAVCVGYATTFRLFMNMMGMDCHIVHNEYHSWDLVQLDDGEWYHTDVYSDANTGPCYRNFNMDDAAARNGHDWDGSALPDAKGVKYTAANQKKQDLDRIEDVPADLKARFDEGERVFYYQFKKVTEDDYPVADYIVSQLQSAFSNLGMDAYISGAWYNNEDESRGYIMGLSVETYDSTMGGLASEVSEDKQQALTDAINQAFGTEIGTEPYSYDPEVTNAMDGDMDYIEDTEIGDVDDIAGIDKMEEEYADEDGK